MVPAAAQQTEFLGAADQWRQALDDPGIEASARPAFANDAPQPSGTGNALEFVGPKVLVFERGTGKTERQFPDCN